MSDIKKQIKYWSDGANSDLETAVLLIKNKKYLHGLFFCHLTIEKILKAHVVKTTKEISPRTHNLLWLSEKAKIELPRQEIEFMGILMKYQLEGRYPDYMPYVPKAEKINEYLRNTKQLIIWLKKRL